jgi:hypothetical protein
MEGETELSLAEDGRILGGGITLLRQQHSNFEMERKEFGHSLLSKVRKDVGRLRLGAE